MTVKLFSITDLDQLLADDRDGRHLRSLQRTLTQAAADCRSRLDQGVPPDEARDLHGMMAACSAGLGLLPALWQFQQERT